MTPVHERAEKTGRDGPMWHDMPQACMEEKKAIRTADGLFFWVRQKDRDS